MGERLTVYLQNPHFRADGYCVGRQSGHDDYFYIGIMNNPRKQLKEHAREEGQEICGIIETLRLIEVIHSKNAGEAESPGHNLKKSRFKGHLVYNFNSITESGNNVLAVPKHD